MTLENLLAIHRLQRFEPDAAGIQRLLAAAERPINPPHAGPPAARHNSVRRRAKPAPRASSSCLK